MFTRNRIAIAILVFVVFVVLMAIANMVNAQDAPDCGPRDPFADYLRKEWGEGQRFVGMTTDGTVVEIWTDSQDGSWTAIETYPDGITCIRAEGQGAQLLDAPLPGEEG